MMVGGISTQVGREMSGCLTPKKAVGNGDL